MTTSRHGSPGAAHTISLLALVVLLGCGDDDGAAGTAGAGATGGDAGESGEGGSGGAAGSSGEGGTCGEGGSGGAAGSSGEGGTSGEGGSGGDAGTSGDGGTGGDAGTGGDSGSAGDGGTGGDAGTGGVGGGLPSATASHVATGRLHACAITTAGAARCWGYSDYGQRGDGTMLPVSSIAVNVEGLDSGVTQIASSIDHTCAIHNGGAVCWGANAEGQLGAGHTTDQAVPRDVIGLSSGVVAIAAGFAHSCALLSSGAVKCWGSNDDGQLGNDSQDDSDEPVDVIGITAGATAVSAGRNHSCAVVSGALKCWGSNDYGELGNDSTTRSGTPVDVVGLTAGVTAVSAGGDFTCAIVSGAAKCWGNNRSGQVGNGDGGLGMETHVPSDVVGLTSGVTSISAGYGFTCAIASGAAKCWGSNGDGNLGNGETLSFETDEPVSVTGLQSGVASIAISSATACALTSSGAVLCWGDNSGGQLGDGTTDRAHTPVAVVSLP